MTNNCKKTRTMFQNKVVTPYAFFSLVITECNHRGFTSAETVEMLHDELTWFLENNNLTIKATDSVYRLNQSDLEFVSQKK